jgi:hypothetical protein
VKYWRHRNPLMFSKLLHSTVPIFIHAQFIYGHWHVCVNGCRTSGVMYTSSWHSFTINVYTHFANDWYGRAKSNNALVALHDTLVCLCPGQLTFPHSHTLPPFLNKVTNKISAHALPNTSPHLLVTFINLCHMLHSLHQHFGQGEGPMTYGLTLVCVCMSICICVTFHVGDHLKGWRTDRTKREGRSYE